MKPTVVEKPCVNCPFRREGGIRVRADRLPEIIADAGSFPCHKTVNHDNRKRHKELACAGAIIFNYKTGESTQMMRIMERLGMIQRSFVDDPWPEIYDDEMSMAEDAL